MSDVFLFAGLMLASAVALAPAAALYIWHDRNVMQPMRDELERLQRRLRSTSGEPPKEQQP